MRPSWRGILDALHAMRSSSTWRKLAWLLRRAAALLGAWLFLMLIMIACAGWYTSRPQFCNSCHIMEPYYKSWQESPHKDVTCIECHFPPGIGGKVRGKLLGLVQLAKYLTASAGPRPAAEIPDASCLRSGCHETRLLTGRVDFHGIPFDHAPHLTETRRGKQLRCTSCHSQIVQGKHMTVTTSTCFLCHFKDQPFNEGLSACTHCHQIPTGSFDLGGGAKFTHDLAYEKGVDCAYCHRDVIRGNGEVPRQRCLSCHNREGDLARFSDHAFIHAKHVTEHKVDCLQCHTEIQHSLQHDKLDHARADCQSCHPDHHQEQLSLLLGKGGETSNAHGDGMSAVRVECRTCHRLKETSATGTVLWRASAQMCTMCHDAATVKKFETYHVKLRASLPRIEAAAAHAREALKASKLDEKQQARLAVELAAIEHDIELLRTGNDVHNMHYATKLNEAMVDRLRAICRALKVPEPEVVLPPPLPKQHP